MMRRPFATLLLSLAMSVILSTTHAEINVPPSPNSATTTPQPLTNQTPPAPGKEDSGTPLIEEPGYDQPTIIEKASAFFGDASEGIAKGIEMVFQKYGRPNAYIEGQEIGVAIALGVRYGDGRLISYNGNVRRIYWQGPSVGFDMGLNAAKVFILVYHLPSIEAIFQRFPGIEGTLYYYAGGGITYMQSSDIILAPICMGLGFRTGASIGYMNITTSPSWNPF